MMSLNIDPQNNVPLVDQIVSGLRARIDERLLMPGARLPSIRMFAREHKVSRFTVVEAYDRLVALGYVQSRRGSGFFATGRETGHRNGETVSSPDYSLDVVWLFRRFLDNDEGRVLAGGPWLPDEWLDEAGLRRHLAALSRIPGQHVLGYGNPKGYLPLREQLQLRLSDLGIAVDQDNIVLTTGVSQGLDLLMRTLLKPGDCVLVDDPGYYNFFANLRAYGVKLHGVPRNHDGPDIAAIAQLAETHKPKLYFTQSAMQNPTGGNISPAVAFQLLQTADKYDFRVVEDDIFRDLQPVATQRLATLDQLHRVIYVSSFSKTLSGSLRVGYLAARPEIVERVADMKMLSCITSSQFAERLVHQMLVEGRYRKFVERLSDRLETARNGTLKEMARIGMEVFVEPTAGMFVWARFPGMDDSAALSHQGYREGVVLFPGAVFRPNLEASPWMRFNVSVFEDPKVIKFLESVNQRSPEIRPRRDDAALPVTSP